MRFAVSALVLLLCACRDEPSFEERYSSSANEIEQRARELDEQLESDSRNSAGGTQSQAQTGQ